jgi:hypothetical protein
VYRVRAFSATFRIINGYETGTVTGQIIQQNGQMHSFIIQTAKQNGGWVVSSFIF